MAVILRRSFTKRVSASQQTLLFSLVAIAWVPERVFGSRGTTAVVLECEENADGWFGARPVTETDWVASWSECSERAINGIPLQVFSQYESRKSKVAIKNGSSFPHKSIFLRPPYK